MTESPAIDQRRRETGAMAKHARLTFWQKASVGLTIASVSVVLFGYGAAGSWESLSHLAALHRVPLPRLAPVGLDGGLIGTIVLDIVLTWIGCPLWWLRQCARLFAIGTVTANAAAGWPDPYGVFLRVWAPVLIVVVSEAVRSVLLRRDTNRARGVPVMRWVLSPRPTFRLWRRMVLWDIRDYASAVDMELSRLRAISSLSARYGTGWEGKVPGDLAWMLAAGVHMPDALTRVAELTAPVRDTAQGTSGDTVRAPARASVRDTSWPSARGISDAELVTRLKAWRRRHPGEVLTAKGFGAALRVTISRARAGRILKAAERPALHLAGGKA